jgi:hypothetical protein
MNPMLALRNIACSDCWEEAWPQITCELRLQATQHRAELRQKRTSCCAELPALAEATIVTEKTDSTPTARDTYHINRLTDARHFVTPSPQDWRPAANHPWRLYPIGKARYQSAKPKESAKL